MLYCEYPEIILVCQEEKKKHYQNDAEKSDYNVDE